MLLPSTSGGTILTSLSSGEYAWAKDLNLSALVRNEEQAAVVRASGFRPVIVSSYDNIDAWTAVAKEFDSELVNLQAIYAMV